MKEIILLNLQKPDPCPQPFVQSTTEREPSAALQNGTYKFTPTSRALVHWIDLLGFVGEIGDWQLSGTEDEETRY